MILSILVFIGVIALALYVLETYFPKLDRIVRAALVAMIVAAVLGLLRSWICGWLCT
jgi:hypothetical protein